MERELMRILVVAAHPDDEVLGCGGTIAKLADEGHEVYAAILGEGITSRYSQPESDDPTQTDALKEYCRKAAKCLGIKDLFFHRLPDNQFDTVPLLDIIKIIEDIVDRVEPMTIYTHHGGDLNIDHAIVHRAVLTATRPVKNCTIKDIYAFEVASATEWSFQQFRPIFRPTVYIDITKTLDTKIQALKYYESEVRTFPHPRSPEALQATAQKWGSLVGVRYAEAFELIRSIR